MRTEPTTPLAAALARAEAAEARESALSEALTWAIAEIEGRTCYKYEDQLSACLELARDALGDAQ